jgi:hypothetical protein
MLPAMVREDSVADVVVGTSGWTYDSWKGPFYPQ